ncbi:MAG: Na+/H+ antiporter NhaC [Rhizobiales bacterium]|nr:Na+/H+ antiporter NhaC [Hyphomicrobiales bacterium]
MGASGQSGDEGPPTRHRPVTFAEALVPVVALILLVALSYFLFGDAGAKGPNQIALVLAGMVALIIGRRAGYTLTELSEAANASVATGIGAIFILFAVGALIGAWALSGTLLAMVYYGLQLLSPSYFYVSATLACAVISAAIGSSWTVAGTVGIGLMGISTSMGLDPGITAAAVISGAYFGDTTSPLSDSANLAAGSAGANLYAHLRETLPTSFVALVLALVIFWMLGERGHYDGPAEMQAISEVVHISPWLFLPLLVVVVLAAMKVTPFTTIICGALAGGVLAVIVSPDRVAAFADGEGLPRFLMLIKGVWLALASGYVSTTGDAAIDAIATRGGMESMLSTIWLIIAAFAFGGVVDRIGVLDRLIAPVVTLARSGGALVAALVGSVVATNILTADQYLSIVLPGRMFKTAIAQRGLAPVVLSRSIGASGTPTSALVPWNSCGAYMAATLGVATWDYLPYAVFNFASPLLVILAATLGLRMLKAPPAPAALDGAAGRG